MIFRGVATHDQNDIGVGDIGPAVRHGPAAERGGQTGHRGAVSKTGLIFVSDDSETEAKLAEQVVDLIGVGAAADHGGIGEAIHKASGSILNFEPRIAGGLDQPRHAFNRVIPGERIPFAGAGSAIQRLCETLIVVRRTAAA